MGFGALRVINEAQGQPGKEFARRDVEIVSCALKGALEHGDSLDGSVHHLGDMQLMRDGQNLSLCAYQNANP